MSAVFDVFDGLLDVRGLASGTPQPVADTLIDDLGLEPSLVDQASEVARANGISTEEVLKARGEISAADMARARARQEGAGYIDLASDPAEPGAGRHEDVPIYLKHRVIPWRRVGKLTVYAAATRPAAKAAMAELGATGGLAFFGIAPQPQIDQAIMRTYGPEVADRAVTRVSADDSVRGLDMGALCIAVLFVAAVTGLLVPLSVIATSFIVLLLLVNLFTMATRLAAMLASKPEADVVEQVEAAGAVSLASHRRKPRLSVLIPLYGEAAMIEPMIDGLNKTTYPRECLDVKILLEENDRETITAVEACDLPPWVSTLVVPDGAPRTKPRAMNAALDFCDGDIIGILDAEDQPDPQQFADVATHLQNAPSDVACVQCQLSYFNTSENWITRCFTLEYAIWFGVLMRGFQRLGLPIPLGGTSVYFRRNALLDLGGWDAHNVTEDADLGMRLSRRGMRCTVLPSTTMEEANCRFVPWVRQRSRWLKGYIVTWLRHMSNPRALLRDLGPVGFVGLNVLFLGGAVTYLGIPVFWVAVFAAALSGQSILLDSLPEWATFPFALSLLAGQIVMMSCALLAARRRGVLGLAWCIPTLPLYWTIGSIAAWKAVIEVVAAPYYWDKTRHGITKQKRSSTSGAVEEDAAKRSGQPAATTPKASSAVAKAGGNGSAPLSRAPKSGGASLTDR